MNWLFRFLYENPRIWDQLGLIHTRHFGTKYCDKKINDIAIKIFLSHRFPYPTKVSSEKNVTYLELRAYLGQKKPVVQNYLRNIFLSQYCVQKYCVWIRPYTAFFARKNEQMHRLNPYPPLRLGFVSKVLKGSNFNLKTKSGKFLIFCLKVSENTIIDLPTGVVALHMDQVKSFELRPSSQEQFW